MLSILYYRSYKNWCREGKLYTCQVQSDKDKQHTEWDNMQNSMHIKIQKPNKSDYRKGVYQQLKYYDFIPNHIERLGETESNIYEINRSPDDHLADRLWASS